MYVSITIYKTICTCNACGIAPEMDWGGSAVLSKSDNWNPCFVYC